MDLQILALTVIGLLLRMIVVSTMRGVCTSTMALCTTALGLRTIMLGVLEPDSDLIF